MEKFPGDPQILQKPGGGGGGGQNSGEGVSSFSRKYPPRCGITYPTRIYRYPKGVPPFFVEKPPRWGGSIRYTEPHFLDFLGVFSCFWVFFRFLGILCFWWILIICLRRGVTISSTFVHKSFAIVVGVNSAFCYELHLQLDPKWVAIVRSLFSLIFNRIIQLLFI